MLTGGHASWSVIYFNGCEMGSLVSFADVNMPSEKLVDLLLGMLRKLPDESRVVFRALLRTLALVASPDSDNDIDQEHLSILFGPLLVGQMLSTSNASAKRKSLLSPIYKKGTEVVQLLIEHHAVRT